MTKHAHPASANRVLNWGFLSTASINDALVPPLRLSARNRLLAVASRDQERATRYAEQRSIPRAYGSYEALLADADIDVVYISLPNSLHCEWTVRAAQAGKHVLCEKPLALSVGEVDRIAAAASRAGVVVAEAFMLRHHPRTMLARDIVTSGRLGAVQSILAAHSFSRPAEERIRLVPELGGGSLWDVGCYPVELTRYLLGSEPLQAWAWQALGETGVDESFAGTLVFPGSIVLQFHCGFRTPLRPQYQIAGSEAMLSIGEYSYTPGFNNTMTLIRNKHEEIIHTADQMPFWGEIEDMADAILTGKAPRVSLAESRGNAAALTALLRSAATGLPVSIASS